MIQKTLFRWMMMVWITMGPAAPNLVSEGSEITGHPSRSLLGGVGGVCQDDDKKQPKLTDAELAAKILAHDIGTWDCTWDYLDREGNTKRTTKGTESIKYSLGKQIVEMETAIPEGKLVSKSLRFYNPVINKLVLLSVGSDGNHWELHQDPKNRVMISKPHKTARGGIQYIRFTTVSQTDDEINVLMEQSFDNQKWFKVFRQKMVRRK